MTVLEDLAGHLSAFQFDQLSASDQDALRVHVLDTICAFVVGQATPDGQAVLAMQRSGRGALSRSPLDDVAVRCAITRLTEIDDIHLPSGTTPGSIVVPTAITLSKHLGVTDAGRFGAAVTAGFEAMTRLGRAVNGQEIVYRGIWTTYFCAPFGAAAVAARLLDLTERQTAHALSMALIMTAGRIGKPGAEKTSRWLMAGHGARAGCFAALSAADDYTGDLDLLDGAWMASAHGLETDAAAFTDGFDGGSVAAEISTKPYCSAKQLIAAICGFEEILGRGIDPDAIDHVVVSVPETYAAMIDHGVIAGNRLSSVTSAPYQLSLAAYDKAGLFDVARSEYRLSDDITGLMTKISVAVDNDLAAHMPSNWPARVDVAAGGRAEQITLIEAPGDPAAAFDLAKMTEKFHAFADHIIGEAETSDWIILASAALSDGISLTVLQEKFQND